MVRGRLLKLWREARSKLPPVAAWASIVENAEKRASYTSIRGHGGLVRASWDEVNELIAAAMHNHPKHGPDRVAGFSPIPAMSWSPTRRGALAISRCSAACACRLRLVLRPAARLTADLGRADGRAGERRLVQCRLHYRVGLQRAPDPHARRPFYTEVRYKGTRARLSRRTMPRPPCSPTSG